jgi:hypothetical protein
MKTYFIFGVLQRWPPLFLIFHFPLEVLHSHALIGAVLHHQALGAPTLVNIYSHAIKSAQEAASDALDGVLLPPSNKTTG